MAKRAKRSVSLRIDDSDFDAISAVADRLGVRASDVFRYAIRVGLGQLMPLRDATAAGRDVMPVFIECGRDIANYFNVDAKRLNAVINGPARSEDEEVAWEDVEMLAMSGMQEPYLCARLSQLTHRTVSSGNVNECLKGYLTERYLLVEDVLVEDGQEHRLLKSG